MLPLESQFIWYVGNLLLTFLLFGDHLLALLFLTFSRLELNDWMIIQVCHAIQWSPFMALVLNLFPESCYSDKPDHLRLAVPDLLATFLSSWLLLFSSIYGLAGYLVGMLCYACDPIGHGE